MINDTPAFPCNSPDGIDSYKGLTLREYAAIKICASMVTKFNWFEEGIAEKHAVAKQAVSIADILIEKLNSEGK